MKLLRESREINKRIRKIKRNLKQIKLEKRELAERTLKREQHQKEVNLAAEEKENEQLTCGYCDIVLGDDDVINKKEVDIYKYTYNCRFCGKIVVRYRQEFWLLNENGKKDLLAKYTQKLD